jgi:hypothetical protein
MGNRLLTFFKHVFTLQVKNTRPLSSPIRRSCPTFSLPRLAHLVHFAPLSAVGDHNPRYLGTRASTPLWCRHPPAVFPGLCRIYVELFLCPGPRRSFPQSPPHPPRAPLPTRGQARTHACGEVFVATGNPRRDSRLVAVADGATQEDRRGSQGAPHPDHPHVLQRQGPGEGCVQ